MEGIEEAKANILGGKQRVEAARGHGDNLEDSYKGANRELMQAFKGLEKVLGHLGRVDDRYRDEIKPRNAAMIVELSDASSLFFNAQDEGFWRGNNNDNPTHNADGQYQDFSVHEHVLQESHTELLGMVAALVQAKDTILRDMLPQTDAEITGTPAQQTKDFAQNVAPSIEAIAQEWHDSI